MLLTFARTFFRFWFRDLAEWRTRTKSGGPRMLASLERTWNKKIKRYPS